MEAYMLNCLFDKRSYDPESKIWNKIYVTENAIKWAPEAVVFGNRIIDLLRKGNVPEILNLFEDGGNKVQPSLNGITNYFKNSDIQKNEVIRFDYHVAFNDQKDKIIKFQYLLKLKNSSNIIWYTLNTEVHQHENIISAQNLSGFPIIDENIDAASFSLNVGLLNYFMLFIALMMPALNLWILFLWIETKLKWKWLWLPFTLFGFSAFNYYWGYGYLDFTHISFGFNFPGARFFKGAAFTPWILVVYVPIGSILFLLKIRHNKKNIINKK